VVEKHFTDNNSRVGPDHKFAMNPKTWAEMVRNTRQLERAFGSGNKVVAENERDTVVVQQRCVRAKCEIQVGETISREMLTVLRPNTPGSIKPYEIEDLLGTKALITIPEGKELRWTDVGA